MFTPHNLTQSCSVDCIMARRFYTSLIVAIMVVGSVTSSSPIQKTTAQFSCCDNTVKYSHNLSCEHTWSAGKTTIAEMYGNTRKCESPCKKIEADQMILDECVNVTVDTVCAAEGKISERRVTYLGQTCRLSFTNGKPAGNQGSAGPLLLAVLTGRLLRFIS